MSGRWYLYSEDRKVGDIVGEPTFIQGEQRTMPIGEIGSRQVMFRPRRGEPNRVVCRMENFAGNTGIYQIRSDKGIRIDVMIDRFTFKEGGVLISGMEINI